MPVRGPFVRTPAGIWLAAAVRARLSNCLIEWAVLHQSRCRLLHQPGLGLRALIGPVADSSQAVRPASLRRSSQARPSLTACRHC